MAKTRTRMQLTADEWNMLQRLTEYNHMDAWFDLRSSRSGYDYVHGMENGGNVRLVDAMLDVCEGALPEDVVEMGFVSTWNSMVARFGM